MTLHKADIAHGIKYWELTLKHGDEQAKKYAQGEIEELKKEIEALIGM